MDANMIVAIVVGVLIFMFLSGFVLIRSGCISGNCQSGGSKGQVVLFHAPWCGHCQDLMPTWTQLEKEFPGQVISVNADENKELVNKFGVDGFPTIYYCPNGKNNNKDAESYEGSRDYDALKKYVQSNL